MLVRLEVDEQLMTVSSDVAPLNLELLVFLVWFGGGIALGAFSLASLWLNVRRLAANARVSPVLAAMACRLIVIGGALTAASLQGALPLLATASGLVLTRVVLVRCLKEGVS